MIERLRNVYYRLGKHAERGVDVLEDTALVLIPRYALIVLIVLVSVPVFVPLVVLGYLAGPKKRK